MATCEHVIMDSMDDVCLKKIGWKMLIPWMNLNTLKSSSWFLVNGKSAKEKKIFYMIVYIKCIYINQQIIGSNSHELDPFM